MAVTIDRSWIGTDDDGSGTTGTVINAAYIGAECDAIDAALTALPVDGTSLTAHGVLIGNGTGAVAVTAAGTAGQVLTSNGASADPTYGLGWTVISPTDTGTQNDYAPGLVGHTVIRLNNASLVTISGFAGGASGQRVRIISIGAGQVDFVHQATSTAANQLFNTVTVGHTSLAPGTGTAEYIYDATTQRWRLISHCQGAPIATTFSAGDYTGGGSQTFTVASGDVTVSRYLLQGKTLTWWLAIDNGTVGGTPDSRLNVAYPGGYTNVSAGLELTMSGLDNNVRAQMTATFGASTVVVRLLAGGNWAASTNQTGFYLLYTFEAT